MTRVATTLGTGSTTSTDNQSFCYDEQNRLTWASSYSGTGPCGIVNNGGSLTAQGAKYTQPFTYDTLDRLTTGPAGTYTYGDPAHEHAVTATSSGYTAAYGAAGNMYCRVPSSSTTCSGSPTSGQPLTYDVEHRPVGWQSAPSGGSTTPSTDSYLYDGEGRRVEQDAVQQLSCPLQAPTQGSCGSIQTNTVYLSDDVEEIATNASGTVTSMTKNYSAGGLLLGTMTTSNGTETLHCLASDGLGSVTVALDTNGNVTAQQLYGPYGSVRYSWGTMPTARGFTGQQGDALTGLDYYGARYYDPVVGQFLTPDNVDAAGPNRYGYVGGNPETDTDPNGHCWLVCAVIAAVATAVVATAVDAVVQQVTTGQVDWGAALKTGATAGLMVGAAIALGPAAAAVEGTIAGGLGGGAVASVAAAAAVGAGEGAAFQVGDNVLNGRDWREGVGQAALIGGVSAGVLSGAGEALGALRAMRAAGEDAAGAAGDDAAAMCGLSFAPDTAVATPDGGERAISSLRVGDAVQAYDPSTGKATTQHVTQVFINHDTDLLDVTLQVTPAKTTVQTAGTTTSASASSQQAGHTNDRGNNRTPQSVSPQPQDAQGAEVETIHTTANHPWLTADRGWEQAGVLRVGEAVVTADGGSAVVVSVRVVSGTAAMWDLTVSNVHTFAVGSGEYVVHNCTFGSNDSDVDWGHIRNNHMEGGSNTAGKTIFENENMSAVKRIVRTAWAAREKVGGPFTQGFDDVGQPRLIQRWMGRAGSWLVGGYYDMTADMVDTAFPIYPEPTEDGSLRVRNFWPRGYK